MRSGTTSTLGTERLPTSQLSASQILARAHSLGAGWEVLWTLGDVRVSLVIRSSTGTCSSAPGKAAPPHRSLGRASLSNISRSATCSPDLERCARWRPPTRTSAGLALGLWAEELGSCVPAPPPSAVVTPAHCPRELWMHLQDPSSPDAATPAQPQEQKRWHSECRSGVVRGPQGAGGAQPTLSVGTRQDRRPGGPRARLSLPSPSGPQK